ncbi:MAG: transglutaminase domain-containing protein [Thermoplasmata archaeon]
MADISEHQGLGQFGRAYKILFENDTHGPGSIDRTIMENMIRLCSETAPYLYGESTQTRSLYKKGSRPELERYAQEAVLGCHSEEERIEAVARFTSSLQENVSDDLDTIQVGGTEEEIIKRGSNWCSDVARVACALCQVAGLPARMVILADTKKAYSGHMIIEVHRSEAWGAVDPLTNVVYRHARGRSASAWDLMNDSRLVERHWRGESTPYTIADQFRGVAISNYFSWRWKEYDYSVSKINDYYRPILEMSDQGWPGGLRWLHGEDDLTVTNDPE